MANMTNKKELITYFEDKSRRSAEEGGAYFETVNSILTILNETDDIAKIKSSVRSLHREKLKEIQQTESVDERVEMRKQLGVYDDLLTQIRSIPV